MRNNAKYRARRIFNKYSFLFAPPILYFAYINALGSLGFTILLFIILDLSITSCPGKDRGPYE